MIQIAQDNDTTPQTLDEMFTQEEQKALIERGFLGTPTPAEKAPTPMEIIEAYLESIIDRRVEEKVSQIMQSHATIALISEEQKELIRSAIEERMFDHENEHDHDAFCTTGEMREIAEEVVMEIDLSEKIDRAVSRSSAVEDALEEKFDDKFDEKFDEKIDEIDWEEKVREGLTRIIG